MIAVRDLAPEDRGDWRALYTDYNASGGYDVSENHLNCVWDMLMDESREAYGLAASQNGRMAGFAHYMLYPTTHTGHMTCYLQDLYVSPDFRRLNLATTLINFIVDRGRREKWRQVSWKTRPDNEISQKFYDKIARRSPWVYYDIALDTT